MMNRRRFILTSSTTAFAAYISVKFGFLSLEEKAVHFLSSLLRNKYYYLDLDKKGLERYCRDFLNEKSIALTIKTGLVGFYLSWVNDYDIVKKRVGSHRVDSLEEELSLSFLLSTDFFYNNSNEERRIQYIGLYSPFNEACRNPFARLS